MSLDDATCVSELEIDVMAGAACKSPTLCIWWDPAEDRIEAAALRGEEEEEVALPLGLLWTMLDRDELLEELHNASFQADERGEAE